MACVNGHETSDTAAFCTVCGAPVMSGQQTSSGAPEDQGGTAVPSVARHDRDMDEQVTDGGPSALYRPGESVNGYILGTDGEWHPQKTNRGPSKASIAIVVGISIAVLVLGAVAATLVLMRDSDTQGAAQAEATDTPEQEMTRELEAVWGGMSKLGRKLVCGGINFKPLRETAYDTTIDKVVADSEFTEVEARQVLTDEMFDDFFGAKCATIGL